MISGTADDYFPHPQAEIIDAQDRTVLRTGIPMEAEMEVQRLDGEKVFSMITRFPVLDSVGHVIGIGGIHMNISEIKEKERQLRSEEHTSELQSLMRISYAVFCLKKKNKKSQKKKIQR